MRKQVRTEKAALAAIKKGDAIEITGMIALTLANIASADIVVMPDAYLSLTLDSSQATVETLDSSRATVETRDSSQAAVVTWGSSQAAVVTWNSRCPVPANITAVGGEPLPDGTPNLLREVASAALANDSALRMGSWHCGTSHSIAGWATHLAGDRGKELESRLGTATAGLILLGRDAQAHFYDTDEQAREWLAQFLPSPEQAA